MKKIISTVLPSLIVAMIVAVTGFIISTKVSQAVVEEKLRGVDKYMEMIISRLDRIERKLDER